MNEHTTDPDARSWDDLKHDLDFTAAERAEIDTGAQRLVAEARAYRLSEVRRRRHITQVEVAKEMGVTQARVSRIEKGQLVRSEVDTLAAYVQALGGRLEIVADFGGERLVVG
jgi:DNA-binding XRE family transcriptional regulator